MKEFAKLIYHTYYNFVLLRKKIINRIEYYEAKHLKIKTFKSI